MDPRRGPECEARGVRSAWGVFLVAYRDDRPVGCGGVKQLDDATGEIKRLYVVPDARGSGVARRLLGALEDAGKERGWRAVRLDTGNRQPEALNLFRSAGYEEIPDYNANAYATYWFEKSI